MVFCIWGAVNGIAHYSMQIKKHFGKNLSNKKMREMVGWKSASDNL